MRLVVKSPLRGVFGGRVLGIFDWEKGAGSTDFRRATYVV